MIRIKKTAKIIAVSIALAVASHVANAADAPTCKTVRFGMMNWTDLMATTSVAKILLQQMGYETSEVFASQPIIFSAIRDNRLDTFLGYWSPSTDQTIRPFLEKKELKLYPHPNLPDGQMTLAVPTWLAEQGLKSFSDIHRFKNKLEGRIYGIDPGTDVNGRLKEAIAKNRFGLNGFQLIESGEVAMLAAVTRADKRKSPIVFLAWKPHPMNIRFDLTYLEGSDNMMGPEEGKATVWTVTRSNYAAQCPNVDKFLKNLTFTSSQEAEMMQRIIDKEDPMTVAKDFISKNPELVESWLAGVTTFTGDNIKTVATNN